MVALSKSNRYETKPFWGLVEQVGPWKTTASDRQRSALKDHPTIGGGIEAGGRGHAGHGEWMKIFSPYQLDASPSVPKPSSYAMRSVVTKPVDMKRQTKMGRVKKGVTMAARTPIQSGEKMGMSTQTENIEQGQRLGTAPGQVLPDLIADSYAGESSDYGLPTLEQTAPFLAEHQIAETHEWMNNSLARELHTEVMEEPKLAVSKRETVSYAPSRPRLATVRGGTISIPTLKPMEIARGYLQVQKGEQVSIPTLDDQMQIDQPIVDDSMMIDLPKKGGPVVKVEKQIVPTFKPPPINLALSESFMKSIADYEEGEIMRRKQKMEIGKDKKAIPVPTGEGKKLAMSEKALGKMAEKRGLTAAAKTAGVIPEKPKKTNGIKIKPKKKTTVSTKPVKVSDGVSKSSLYQPATPKVVKALRKRIGDTKIRSSFKTMKESNPQYKIFKAAYEQWLAEK